MTESEGTDPLKVTCPKVRYFARIVFRSRNAIAFSNDVFPLPDGPMTTLSTPARKVVVTGYKMTFLGCHFPEPFLLSRTRASPSKPRSIIPVSWNMRSVIFSFPADKSVSEVWDREIEVSALRNRKPKTDKMVKKATNDVNMMMGRATQLLGNPSESMTKSPEYGWQAGFKGPPGSGHS